MWCVLASPIPSEDNWCLTTTHQITKTNNKDMNTVRREDPKKVPTKNCIATLLVRSGIEQNPGPDTQPETLINTSTQSEIETIDTLDKINIHDPQTLATPTTQSHYTKRPRPSTPSDPELPNHDFMESLRLSQARIESKLDKILIETEASNIRVTQLETQNSHLTQQVQTLTEEIHSMKKKSIDLENRSRETNLLFYGLKTNPTTKPDECWDIVTDFLKKDLNLSNVFIDRAHILGKAHNPPIIAKLPRSHDRQLIFSKAHMLRDTNISIAQDYAWETREARRELIQYRKSHATNGEKTQLKKDTLYIQNVPYTYENGEVIMKRKPYIQKSNRDKAEQYRPNHTRQIHDTNQQEKTGNELLSLPVTQLNNI